MSVAEASGRDLGVVSLTAANWIGIVAAVVSAVVHLRLGFVAGARNRFSAGGRQMSDTAGTPPARPPVSRRPTRARSDG